MKTTTLPLISIGWRARAARASLAVIVLAILALAISCKKDPPVPPVEPLVTTSPVTVSGGVATGGGEITDDGRSPITAAGLAWSSTNTTPTLADDTTKNALSGKTFTATISGLEPSTTYYFRAYATNAVGTAYGEVVTVNTENGGPEARNTGIEGNANITNKIKATFTYFDHEGDAQAPGTYQWYVANDSTSGPGTAISGATDSIYTIPAADQGRFLRAAITPKAEGGSTTGAVAYTPWMGPIGDEPTTVTFMYNGEEVTYGIITSPTTGKKWLDRNIGAKQAATNIYDYLAFGDLFQWGRPADGHQLMNWQSSTVGVPVNSETTDIKSATDIPGHAKFITVLAAPRDWREDNNMGTRWTAQPQGPCPIGWHIPANVDWKAEMNGEDNTLSGSYSWLKLTICGSRDNKTGLEYMAEYRYASYWGSGSNGVTIVDAVSVSADDNTVLSASIQNLCTGNAVRCIRD